MENLSKEFEIHGVKFVVTLAGVTEVDYGVTMLDVSASWASGERTFRVPDCINHMERTEAHIMSELSCIVSDINIEKKRRDVLIGNGWK